MFEEVNAGASANGLTPELQGEFRRLVDVRRAYSKVMNSLDRQRRGDLPAVANRFELSHEQEELLLDEQVTRSWFTDAEVTLSARLMLAGTLFD